MSVDRNNDAGLSPGGAKYKNQNAKPVDSIFRHFNPMGLDK
jgi:hypothetical protein